MSEISAQAPIGGDIKKKKISNKGLVFEVKDGQDHFVYPTLPGIVTEIDDEEVTIEHKKFINEDIVSIYNIDGDVKVKKGQAVSQSTVLGVTDDEVEFFVKRKGSFIDAEKFLGTKFGADTSTMSIQQRVDCFMKNLIAAPYKIGGMKKDDPCWSMYHKDKEEQSDTTVPDGAEDATENPEKSIKTPELQSGDKELPSGQKGLPSGDQKGLPSGDKEKSFWDGIAQDVDFEEITESVKKQNLIEEITRIKELLK